jgi:CDP-diacylglycerol--glycerol-3-phosphate 3-phosphatidyltransferase
MLKLPTTRAWWATPSTFLARGNFPVGGLVLDGPIDTWTGRYLRGESSDFGAFGDPDGPLPSLHLRGPGTFVASADGAIVLTFVAAAGSVLVSYVKARAESLDFEAKGGMLTRFERYLILAPALVLTGFGVTQAALVGIALIAVLANVTALQRIRAVRQQARRRGL